MDLHCHSLYSDGILTPTALLESALAVGLRYFALTDHDSMAGWDELYRHCPKHLSVMPAIEWSSTWKKHEIHIVGLQVEPDQANFQDAIEQQHQRRIRRAQAMGDALWKACGLEDAYEKAAKEAGHLRVSRPHFAKVLVQEGKVKDIQRAFKQYLGRGKPAYIPTPWLDVDQSVALIRDAGGIPVLAHPLKYGLTRTQLKTLITVFQQAGGVGLEVVSGLTTQSDARDMAALATQYGLLASTGSDFHGEGLSRVKLGCQLALPDSCVSIQTLWA